jgi:hypothetical protein
VQPLESIEYGELASFAFVMLCARESQRKPRFSAGEHIVGQACLCCVPCSLRYAQEIKY